MFCKIYKRIQLCLIICIICGCAEIDQGLQKTTDAVAPEDIMGRRLLNPESEAEEISRTTAQTSQILQEEKDSGHPSDTDTVMLGKLQNIMKNISKVSHRPNIPWEVHLIESPEINAFAIGGGKVFFYRGAFGNLIDETNDNEIAAVMAHEMGHITARHIGKREGLALAQSLSNKARKSTGGKIYQGSFTTLQEDEADRIGILYMSLAGYDPNVVPNMWEKANEKFGSDPQDYSYDHSLSKDRAEKTRKLVPLASEYFMGQGKENINYSSVLSSNTLIQSKGATGEYKTGGGTASAAVAIMDNYTQHLQAKTEEINRESQKLQEENKKRIEEQREINTATRLSRINFNIQETSDGMMGIFGKFQNLSNQVMRKATVTVVYINAAGQPIYQEPVELPEFYLMPGQTTEWSAYMKNVPGSVNVVARPTKVEWQ